MAQRTVGSNHPALAGHFPGRPVVPAAVVLMRVRDAVAERHPGLRVAGIRKAKFLRALGPDEAFEIELGEPGGGGLRFACRTAAGTVAEGRLSLERPGGE